MPNDVSAFITPVRDLNDEPCALVKVEAPSDFAFSTPLGIVSRKDEVGENRQTGKRTHQKQERPAIFRR